MTESSVPACGVACWMLTNRASGPSGVAKSTTSCSISARVSRRHHRGQADDVRGQGLGPSRGAGAGEGDPAAVQARHAESGGDRDHPDGQRPAVQRVHLPGTGAAEHAVVEHRLGAGEVLLRRLEHEGDRPAEPRPELGQHLGDPDPDGRVQVVPAQVADVGDAADRLPHRHRVHVGPVGDRAARVGAAEQTDHAVTADAGQHREPGGAQPVRHQGGRATLLARGLGVRVDRAPQRDQVRLDRVGHRVDRALVQRTVPRPGSGRRGFGGGCRHPGERRRAGRRGGQQKAPAAEVLRFLADHGCSRGRRLRPVPELASSLTPRSRPPQPADPRARPGVLPTLQIPPTPSADLIRAGARGP